jgi:hypothetical protein
MNECMHACRCISSLTGLKTWGEGRQGLMYLRIAPPALIPYGSGTEASDYIKGRIFVVHRSDCWFVKACLEWIQFKSFIYMGSVPLPSDAAPHSRVMEKTLVLNVNMDTPAIVTVGKSEDGHHCHCGRR